MSTCEDWDGGTKEIEEGFRETAEDWMDPFHWLYQVEKGYAWEKTKIFKLINSIKFNKINEFKKNQ